MGFSTIGTQPRAWEKNHNENDQVQVTSKSHFDTFSYFRGNIHKDGDFWNLVSI